MLRLFQSKIFREDLQEFSIPTISFRNFEDVSTKIDFSNNTYKFCLPLSVGDFPEANVPPCFSNSKEEISQFVEKQKQEKRRKAFMILDLGVTSLEDIKYSGVISTYSMRGLYDYLNTSTSISLALKNPIITAMTTGISPRDLEADIYLDYDHVFSPSASFPEVTVTKENVNINDLKDIIFQAYCASLGIHQVGKKYDGDNYEEHVLFFTDNSRKVWLYDISERASFLKESEVNEELNYVYSLSDIEKPKTLGKK